jgi:ABC-type multidrug transport system fused ATPase/permease subunit
VQGIDQLIQETPHFRIHYTPESFAEQHLTQIGERLGHAYGILSHLLGIDTGSAITIDVYLTELLTDSQPGEVPESSGYAITGTSEIHEVYRADAPGNGLERSLLQVLLGISLSNELALPPLINDGLLAYATQSLEDTSTIDEVMMELAQAKTQHTLPPLNTLFPGPTHTTHEIYYPVAASFVDFLIRTYGENRFQEFLRRLQGGTTDDAAHVAYGRTLHQLDRSWRKTLKITRPGGILRFIKLAGTYLRPYWLQVAEIVIYLACSVAFSIGLARMQGILIDTALIPRDLHALLVIMGILVGAFILVSLALLRQSYLSAYVSESVLRTIRLRMFSLVQHLHPGFFQVMSTGDILSRMTNDLDEIEFAFSEALEEGITMILTLIAAIATIIIIDWKLALVALVGTPLFFITGHFFGPATARASLERQQHLAAATSTAQENLGAQDVVKAFGLQNRVIADYTRILNTLFRSSLRLTFLSGLFGLSVNSIAYIIQLAVLGVGGWLVISGNLTVGTLFTFLVLMGEIIGPMQGISGINQALQQASGAMERVDELLKAEPEIADVPGAQNLQRLSHNVAFEDVAFSYLDGQPALHKLNLDIPAGANVALVGPSGCGKSTTLNLILRFYDPQQGRVAFDDVDLRQATLDSLRGQMGIVFQDNVLFNISIRENIRLGKLAASNAEVENAAKAAEMHELIMSMPQGFDTVVGERGSRLSGGQRQRVAIARAILRDPTILLLDEATSALDPRTEAAINATLERIAHGRTTINVTHRLSGVVNADRIYVFDRGTLLEQGTHIELLQLGGLYAQLWNEQSGAGVEAQNGDVQASLLHDIQLFSHLDYTLLNTLAKKLLIERFAAGDVIITEGEVGDKLYLIARGQVEVLATNPAGKQRYLAVLRTGDHFGEMALLYDIARTATIRAREPVQLYSLNKEDFNELLLSEPALREQIERIMNQRAQKRLPVTDE